MSEELQATTAKNRTIIKMWRRLGLPVEWRFDGTQGWHIDITRESSVDDEVNWTIWYRVRP